MTVLSQGTCLLVVDRDPSTAVTIDTLAHRDGLEAYSVRTAPTIDGLTPIWERHEDAIVILVIDAGGAGTAEAAPGPAAGEKGQRCQRTQDLHHRAPSPHCVSE